MELRDGTAAEAVAQIATLLAQAYERYRRVRRIERPRLGGTFRRERSWVQQVGSRERAAGQSPRPTTAPDFLLRASCKHESSQR